MELDPTEIKKDFPFFTHHKNLSYLDSGATTQKPACVINRISLYYEAQNANIHRSSYALADHTTGFYESAREKTAIFLKAKSTKEIIFTAGCTAALNLVASILGQGKLEKGDEVLLTISEHHSNLVPWQLLQERMGIVLKFIPLTADLRIDLEAAKKLVSKKTKVLAFPHVSNVLGFINPVKELVALGKSVGAITVIDGAQAAPSIPIDVQDIGCDFYAISVHKMLGPMGLGVLYGREALLEVLPPYQGGGDMISKVTLEKSTWNELPYKYEAGTPHVAAVIALESAIDYLLKVGLENIKAHKRTIGLYALKRLKEFPYITCFADDKADWTGVLSFVHKHIHPHDISAFADAEGVCLRTGHHCAQPLAAHLKVAATTRISPYLYNSKEDIDKLCVALKKAEEIFCP